MAWLMLFSNVVGVAAATAIGDRWGRAVLFLIGLPMAATCAMSVGALAAGGSTVTQFVWVADLDLIVAFRLDEFTALVAALVAGIGALVAVYAGGYFAAGTTGVGRFAATLLAFSTAMVGLVIADTVWTLFLFWELTSITSFLLVGHKRLDPVARTAARRALVVTVAGGLALLGGLVLFLDASPGTRLGDLEAVSGSTATTAAVLIMLAAATKSAQVPFHVWLPGAMSAPTPVSAYLHSATMVKAGVVLVAVMSPAFGDVAIWTPLGVTLGAASMIWGAIGALRQVDAKLILAWGTISQLGLMIALLSLGSAKATFAAVSILCAHALFKAALFMVVGEVDVRTGTRDIGQLGGLWRSMPVAFVVALLAAASMAGVPPLLGFPAKEAAVEAALGLGGSDRSLVLAIVVAGSVLTVAYTTRFMLGVFGGESGGAAVTSVAASRWAMVVPSAVLSGAGVVGFVVLDSVTAVVRDAAAFVDPDAALYSLLRWPGITDAFLISVAIVVTGGVVGAVLGSGFGRHLVGMVPRPVGADAVDRGIDGTVGVARRLAGRVQHGSLPAYMLTIVVAAAAATTPFFTSIDVSAVYRWDGVGQAALAGLVLAVAVSATLVGSRLGAALVLGAVGLAVTGLFLTQGAPDLVLTQLLVETVVVVGFVVGLGRLDHRFPNVGRTWLTWRIAVSTIAAVAVAGALASSAVRSDGRGANAELTRAAVDDGGGKNIVNVILTDVRALDTVGEIVVLIAVAIGVIALTTGRDERDGRDDRDGHDARYGPDGLDGPDGRDDRDGLVGAGAGAVERR